MGCVGSKAERVSEGASPRKDFQSPTRPSPGPDAAPGGPGSDLSRGKSNEASSGSGEGDAKRDGASGELHVDMGNNDDDSGQRKQDFFRESSSASDDQSDTSSVAKDPPPPTELSDSIAAMRELVGGGGVMDGVVSAGGGSAEALAIVAGAISRVQRALHGVPVLGMLGPVWEVAHAVFGMCAHAVANRQSCYRLARAVLMVATRLSAMEGRVLAGSKVAVEDLQEAMEGAREVVQRYCDRGRLAKFLFSASHAAAFREVHQRLETKFHVLASDVVLTGRGDYAEDSRVREALAAAAGTDDPRALAALAGNEALTDAVVAALSAPHQAVVHGVSAQVARQLKQHRSSLRRMFQEEFEAFAAAKGLLAQPQPTGVVGPREFEGAEARRACPEWSREVIEAATDAFEEQRVVGRGGFGVVYRGELRSDGGALSLPVAVKRFHKPGDEDVARMVATEAELLGTLRHRHVVRLLATCADPPRLVYELCGGGTLAERLDGKHGGLSAAARLRVLGEVAEAAAFLHSSTGRAGGAKLRGVVHRDIKPENVLLTVDGDGAEARLGDFGTAREELEGSGAATRIVATSAYLCPLYAMSRRFGPGTDVYAAGVTLAQVVAGCRAEDAAAAVLSGHVGSLKPDKEAGMWVEGVFAECVALAQWCMTLEAGGARRPSMETVAGYLRALHLAACMGKDGVLGVVLGDLPQRRREAMGLAAAPTEPSRGVGCAGSLEGDEVAEAMRRGGMVDLDLGGRSVWLRAEAVVAGAGNVVTIRNGTLRAAEAELGEGYALGAREGGEMRLEGVRVVGTGVRCQGDGRVTLADTHVTDAPQSGVRVAGPGCRATVRGGRIAGCRAGHGVSCEGGGEVEVSGVTIVDCYLSGVACCGLGTRVVVRDGSIAGSREGHGVSCEEGGRAEVRGVEIADCFRSGVFCFGAGSAVVVEGGSVVRSRELDGVACEGGGEAEVSGVAIADCKRSGVASCGEGSRVVVRGGSITGARITIGALCAEGGRVEVRDVAVAGCAGNGVAVAGKGSRAVVQGGRVDGVVERDACACEDGAAMELQGVEVLGCGRNGVACSGAGSQVAVQGGRIAGCKEGHGVGCAEGGRAELRDVEIADCAACGVVCAGAGSRVSLRGGRVERCLGGHGVACVEDGEVEVVDVAIVKSGKCGVAAAGEGSRAAVRGVRVEGAAELDGIACELGAVMELRSVEVAGCGRHGVSCFAGGRAELRDVEIADCGGCGLVAGPGSGVAVRGGRIAGMRDGHGVLCVLGGEAAVVGVEIADCGGFGIQSDGGAVLHYGCAIGGCGAGAVMDAGAESPGPADEDLQVAIREFFEQILVRDDDDDDG